MSYEEAKKIEVLNEEIGRYYAESREDLTELTTVYNSLRRKVSSISNGYDLINIGYAITYLTSDDYENDVPLKNGDTPIKNVETRIADLSGKFDAIIDDARKAREYLTAIKIDAANIAAFKKALNS